MKISMEMRMINEKEYLDYLGVLNDTQLKMEYQYLNKLADKEDIEKIRNMAYNECVIRGIDLSL